MRLKVILVMAGVFLSAFVLIGLLVLNVKSSYTTLIRIENQEQYDSIIRGKEPIIDFVSLRDTPFANEVKILKIKFHTTIEHFFDSSKVVSDWLGEIGIRDYPELVGP